MFKITIMINDITEQPWKKLYQNRVIHKELTSILESLYMLINGFVNL